MNLVYCSKKCIFQKDGYCCSNENMTITNLKADNCPFFVEKENKPKPNEKPKSN